MSENLFNNINLPEETNNVDSSITDLDLSIFKDKIEDVKSETNNNEQYTVEDYAKEKNLDKRSLYVFGLENLPNKKGVVIPYLDMEGKLVRNKIRNSPNSSTKFYWGEGTGTTLYNLWNLNKFNDDYLIFVEGESDSHTLMQLNIPVIGVPQPNSFKKEYAKYFNRFKKIYIHSQENENAEQLIKKICSILPVNKLYTISSKSIDQTCKDICDLNVKGKLNIQELLNTAVNISTDGQNEFNPIQKHVEIGQNLIEILALKNYNGNLYTYQNGVYQLATDSLLRNCILKEIDINAKKTLCNEAIDFVKNWLVNEDSQMEVDTRFINFQNGLFDLETKCLNQHTSDIFTVNKVHVNYLAELPPNNLVLNYLAELMNFNEERQKALLQLIGYCLTSKTDIQQIMIWYRTFCF